MHGQITARMTCISYWYHFILITVNERFRIKPEPVQTIPHWYMCVGFSKVKARLFYGTWPVFEPWPPQSWGFGTIFVLQGRVVSSTPYWIASSSCFSPPTCLDGTPHQ
jgi:hypothetical protein